MHFCHLIQLKGWIEGHIQTVLKKIFFSKDITNEIVNKLFIDQLFADQS